MTRTDTEMIRMQTHTCMDLAGRVVAPECRRIAFASLWHQWQQSHQEIQSREAMVYCLSFLCHLQGTAEHTQINLSAVIRVLFFACVVSEQ